MQVARFATLVTALGRRLRVAAAIAVVMLSGISTSRAADFHGFDPRSFDGWPLAPAQFKDMVADAMRVTPPRNGVRYVIGFANLDRSIVFGRLVENGLQAAAAAAGIDLLISDNKLDGPTALANAHAFVAAKVDYVIEFQTDVTFAPDVMAVLNEGGTKTTAIDIPMPGATFFGVNNPKMGYMDGSYLAAASAARFGDRRNDGYLVIGSLPQSGVVPAIRTAAQKAGFLDNAPGFPLSHLITIDTKNTNEESYARMNGVLTRIPPDAAIMVTAINDQAALGMLRAIKEAGREDRAIVVGSGADEVDALVREPALAAAVGSFPEHYGNFLLPIALASLAGRPLPPAVFMTHAMVTKANVCHFSAALPCVGGQTVVYDFPQASFAVYLRSLIGKRDLKGYEALIPND